ncbi:cupredoxin domain-containing protein [Candidatus Woesearchaeota archaeon]|nr:MAG: cupredoxin domain-containing protein [Candidatus Woesearchaeota archaeon]
MQNVQRMNNYLVLFCANLAAIIATAAYAAYHKKHLDEMHGMMAGMTLGMTSGLLAATLIVLPTGNFPLGVIFGSLAGLAFGIPFGKLGGHMGVLEGIMAGPMGGMMGAMLGQMMRPFDLTLFIPFFSAIILLSLIGISYATHCGCCGTKPKKVPNTFVYAWTIGSALIIALSISLNFAIAEPVQEQPGQLKLPAYLQNINQETRGTATLNGNTQEINVSISTNAYTPNTIEARAGIPLRITFRAAKDAGCGREVVIPDFGIKKIVPDDGQATVEITPKTPGNYPFRCSMDMMRGTITITPAPADKI